MLNKTILFMTAFFLNSSILCEEKNDFLLEQEPEIIMIDAKSENENSQELLLDQGNEDKKLAVQGCLVGSKEIVIENEKEKAVKAGIISKMASNTWSMIETSASATGSCVKKVYNAAGRSVEVVYNTANGVFYIVGITTTGFVIYTLYNGEFQKNILIRDLSSGNSADKVFEYLYKLDVPFFGKVMWEMPEAVGKGLQGMIQKSHEFNQFSQAFIEQAGELFGKGNNLYESLNDRANEKGLDSNSRKLLEYLAGIFKESVDEMGKSLNELDQINK